MPIVLVDLFLGGWPFVIMLIVACALAMREWLRMSSQSPNPVKDGVFGSIYIILCFLSFMFIRVYYDSGEWLALALLLSVWASDTGAYIFGKTFKGPKMVPIISPNKTWSGLVGGMVCSALAFLCFAIYVGPFTASLLAMDFSFAGIDQSFLMLLAIGASITISGQIGDLLISKEKRKVGVKDTGGLIPGHGGLLDRIDSLMLASFVFLFTLLFFAS